MWLALLLPIAQAMAGVHALSHAGDGRDNGLAHLVHCDLCVSAANLGTGAPTDAPVALPAVPAVHAAPRLAPAGARCVADAGLPPARAPPVSA
ncbi:MAG: hypothetical protein ACT6S0_20425 [Roseateles sp.]